jgi:hypothetical protein
VGLYRRRRPGETVLYQLVQEHLETFLALSEEGTGEGFPGYVEQDFRMERSGMRWILSGARAMLDMRCIYLGGLWEELTRFASSANPGASTQDVPPTTRISARHSPRSGRGQWVAPLSIYSFMAVSIDNINGVLGSAIISLTGIFAPYLTPIVAFWFAKEVIQKVTPLAEGPYKVAFICSLFYNAIFILFMSSLFLFKAPEPD